VVAGVVDVVTKAGVAEDEVVAAVVMAVVTAVADNPTANQSISV
jgi:hypothetical protein